MCSVGDVVIATFPFSNLASSKKRPAIILAIGDFDDPVLCQITSFRDNSLNTVELTEKSFSAGSLSKQSFARPDKLFTADKSLVVSKLGHLSDAAMNDIKTCFRAVFEL